MPESEKTIVREIDQRLVGKVAVFLPPHFPLERFPPEPLSPFDKRERQERLRKVAFASDYPLVEVPLSLGLIHEAKAEAIKVHGKKRVGRLIKTDLFLKGDESVFVHYDERTAIQHYSAVEALWDTATALAAARELEKGVNAAIVVVRPSHHSSKQPPEGYCLLNKMVIAENFLHQQNPEQTIATLDLDAHFGNGDAAFLMENPNWPYFSLGFKDIYMANWLDSHPLSPEQEKLIHFAALTPGISEEEYLRRVRESLDKISKLNTDILGLHLGFDTDQKDSVTTSIELEGKPISHLNSDSYSKIGKIIGQWTKESNKKLLVVTEGGYDLDLIAADFRSFLEGLKEGLL